ncbi:MAG: hypothetical protein AAFY71_00860 [Bacteroidota bacterium]
MTLDKPSLPAWPRITYGNKNPLKRATEQIHRAAQFVSMTGKHYCVIQGDDSQTNMFWDKKHRLLVGRPIEGDFNFRLGVHPETLSLKVVSEDDDILSELSLNGRLKSEVENWWRGKIKEYGLDESIFNLDLHYDIPSHPTDQGVPFQLIDQQAFKAFADLRQGAHSLLAQVVSYFEDETGLATWPHHFDVGSYLVLERDKEGKMTKAISVGMAIHDQHVDEPYFYVNPWRKEGEIRTEFFQETVEGANWQTGDWTGSILPLSAIVGMESAKKQQQLVLEFIGKSLDQAISALETDSKKWQDR